VLNALVWGFWIFVWASGSFSSVSQRQWYLVWPAVVFFAAVVLPPILLANCVAKTGLPRALLNAGLALTLLGFLPYAFLPQGGM
jgi:hypothetical protein